VAEGGLVAYDKADPAVGSTHPPAPARRDLDGVVTFRDLTTSRHDRGGRPGPTVFIAAGLGLEAAYGSRRGMKPPSST